MPSPPASLFPSTRIDLFGISLRNPSCIVASFHYASTLSTVSTRSSTLPALTASTPSAGLLCIPNLHTTRPFAVFPRTFNEGLIAFILQSFTLTAAQCNPPLVFFSSHLSLFPPAFFVLRKSQCSFAAVHPILAVFTNKKCRVNLFASPFAKIDGEFFIFSYQ